MLEDCAPQNAQHASFNRIERSMSLILNTVIAELSDIQIIMPRERSTASH